MQYIGFRLFVLLLKKFQLPLCISDTPEVCP